MLRTVFFTGGIKLVNRGYQNKVIDTDINEELEEITDTFENAISYILKEYGVKVK